MNRVFGLHTFVSLFINDLEESIEEMEYERMNKYIHEINEEIKRKSP